MTAPHREHLTHGVIRTDLPMMDGRTIRYYDQGSVVRDALDLRTGEANTSIGELRKDSLTNEWVTVAAHRQSRVFYPPKELCPLCPTKPGLESEIADLSYNVVVFDNKSPALAMPSAGWNLAHSWELETSTTEAAGKCEVVCFTSEHEGSFGELPLSQIRLVMEAWQDRVRELSTLPYIAHIAPFENRGEEVGVTLNHPHGQIYAYSFIPARVQRMLEAAREYQSHTGGNLHDDLLQREISDGSRIVVTNEDWVAYVPYAARYPYEIHVVPRVRVPHLSSLSAKAADTFPAIAKEVLLRLDGLFDLKMPYIATWHQAPIREGNDLLGLHWQITCVRTAPGKLKYLAGSESAMGAFIMDRTPESAAQQLREVVLP